MKFTFKLSDEQVKRMTNKYPVYFGGDLRDCVGKWVNERIGAGCYDYFDYDEKAELKYIVTVDTNDQYFMIDLDLINTEVSEFKEKKENE